MARVPALPDSEVNTLHQLMNLKLVRTASVVISSGTALSGAVTLLGMSPVRIENGAIWKGKASVAFRVSEDGTTYKDLYEEDGTIYSVPMATSHAVQIDPQKIDGVQYLKLRAVLATNGLTALAQDKHVTLTVAYKLL